MAKTTIPAQATRAKILPRRAKHKAKPRIGRVEEVTFPASSRRLVKKLGRAVDALHPVYW
jgi:hypothetical protein